MRNYLLGFLLLLFFAINCFGQKKHTVDLWKVTSANDEFENLCRMVKMSTYLASPNNTSNLFLFDTISNTEFYDYSFRLSHGHDVAEENNNAKVRLYFKDDNKMYIKVDTDFDGSINDEKINEIGINNSDTISFSGGLIFEIVVTSINLIKKKKLGGVSIKPLTIFKGNLFLENDTVGVIVKDDILGITIYMEGMYINNRPLKSVKADQGFIYTEGGKYLFNDYSIFDSVINLKDVSSVKKLEGSKVDYYVNLENIQKFIKFDFVHNNNILIYFWGIWCKPCINKFESTLKLYDILRGSNTEMFFCSYNFDEENVIKSQEFIADKINNKHVISVNAKTEMNRLDLWMSYNSLTSQLGVQSFPTYILIDNDGRILYKNSTLSLDDLDLILSNQN